MILIQILASDNYKSNSNPNFIPEI